MRHKQTVRGKRYLLSTETRRRHTPSSWLGIWPTIRRVLGDKKRATRRVRGRKMSYRVRRRS